MIIIKEKVKTYLKTYKKTEIYFLYNFYRYLYRSDYDFIRIIDIKLLLLQAC